MFLHKQWDESDEEKQDSENSNFELYEGIKVK